MKNITKTSKVNILNKLPSGIKSFILITALLNSIIIINTHPITLVILIIIQTLNICMAV